VTSAKSNVVYVLLLVQVGMSLLATLGELLFMGGNLLYAVAPLLRITLTLIFGAMLLRGRRLALVGIVVLQGLSLIGFAASLVIGRLPQVDFTPTLTGVVTTFLLPIVLIVYCGQLLSTSGRPPARVVAVEVPAGQEVSA
jgi:hypothetical protein